MKRFLLVLGFFLLLAANLSADEFPPPKPTHWYSPDGRSRLDIWPGVIQVGRNLEYECIGSLHRLENSGKVTVVWEKPVAFCGPLIVALVSNRGAVVLVSERSDFEAKEDAITIIDSTGVLKKSYPLRELAPWSQIREMPHSTTGIWWCVRVFIDTLKDELVVETRGDTFIDSSDTSGPAWSRTYRNIRELRLNISTGTVTKPVDTSSADIIRAVSEWKLPLKVIVKGK